MSIRLERYKRTVENGLSDKIIKSKTFQKQIVEEAVKQDIQMLCHAPDMLKPGKAIASETNQAAQSILTNSREKWVVHHFDQTQPLENTLRLVEALAAQGLVPCIENFHYDDVMDCGDEHYVRYLTFFESIQQRGLQACAVLDIPRIFDTKLDLNISKATQRLIKVFECLGDLNVPILLHLIDSRKTDLRRANWCPLGQGVIPYQVLLELMFASTAKIEAVIFEYEDKANPLESLPFFNNCLKAGLSTHDEALSISWWG